MTRTIRWFKRSGQRVSKAAVRKAKASFAEAKRTGRMGSDMTCSIQPAVADRIDRMTLIEFANWSGTFTYRKG